MTGKPRDQTPPAPDEPAKAVSGHWSDYHHWADFAPSSDDSGAPRVIYRLGSPAPAANREPPPRQDRWASLPTPVLVSLTPTPQSSLDLPDFLRAAKERDADTATSAYRPHAPGVNLDSGSGASTQTQASVTSAKRAGADDLAAPPAKRPAAQSDYVRTAAGHAGRDVLDTLAMAAAAGKGGPSNLKDQMRYLFGDPPRIGAKAAAEPLNQTLEPRTRTRDPQGREI